MSTKRRKKQRAIGGPFLGFRFDSDRTRKANDDKSLLSFNSVNRTVLAGSTDFDALTAIAQSAQRPIPLKFLSERLRETVLPRGRTFFSDAWEAIDGPVRKYPRLWWWMTSDGLVVDEVPPELESLSEFERIVGSMLSEQRRISKETLQEVAQKLDSDGVGLIEQLQPKERDAIAAEKRKREARAIHNFSTAIANPIAKRVIRRAIYRAREKYGEAIALSSKSDWTPFIG